MISNDSSFGGLPKFGLQIILGHNVQLAIMIKLIILTRKYRNY